MRRPRWTALSWIIVGLALCAVGAIAAGLVLAFMAGCAGDTKSVAYGDVYRAMELESMSFTWSFFGLAAAVVAMTMAYYKRSQNVLGSVAVFFGTPVAGFILLFIASGEIETNGVKYCF
ncbi:MAG: hypothetical protein AB7F76_12395 [Parvibaculaceae bacterium]